MTAGYDLIAEKLAARGDDVERVEAALRAQEVETPSWAFGNSGHALRGVRPAGRAARPVREARGCRRGAPAHRASRRRSRSTSRGTASTTWTRCASTRRSSACGSARSTRTSSRSRSTSSAASATRTPASAGSAVAHVRECIEIATQVGSDAISLWLADGTNYPGQDSLRGAPRTAARVAARDLRRARRRRCELLVEYKLYEPAFYATDLADWGSALLALPGARRAREGARRPRPPRAGREHRADRLAAARRRPAGRLPLQRPQVRRRRPDRRLDRPVPALPDLLRARRHAARSSAASRFTIDQSHNVEPKIEAMIQTVLNLQEAYAKALLVDRAALERAQARGRRARRPTGSSSTRTDTDVRPLCAKVRVDLGASRRPDRRVPRRRLRRARRGGARGRQGRARGSDR